MSSAPTRSLEQLSDSELIALLPATKADKYDESYHKLSAEEKKQLKGKRESFIKPEYRSVLDTLWLRHLPNMRNVLKGKVSQPGSTLCPPQQPSKEDFIAASLLRAYQSFLAQTYRLEYQNFGGFIWARVLRGALDERKHLKGRFDGDDEAAEDSEQECGEQEEAEASTADDGTGPQRPILVPTPEGMPDPSAGELNLLALDVDMILDRYASESEENAVSARALRWRWTQDKSWEEVADGLFPSTIDARTREQRTTNARTFGKKDEGRVLPLLAPLMAPRAGRQKG
jgi:hypothetical protein